MTIDVAAATRFMATSARVLDRRRFGLLVDGSADAGGVLAALDAYRNADGGYGWGLEPDLRSTESQPTAARNALEVLGEVGAAGGARATAVLDWLDAHTNDDGGLPMVAPVTDPAGCAPFWAEGDTTTSSLQMTAQVAAKAHLVARHVPEVADHPWLGRATSYCLDAVARLDGPPHAYVLTFALELLDVLGDVDALARYVPRDGLLPVEGGIEGEVLRPLDLAPDPDGAARRLLDEDAVAGDLERLAGQQQDDGGWVVAFASWSPAAALEWRGYATVEAVSVLRRNGR